MEQDQQAQNNKIARLEQELSRAIHAEEFFSHQSGQLIVALLTEEITKLTRLITSDKYEKDHTGYLKSLSELHANQKLLRKLQTYGSPVVKEKITEELHSRKEVV